MLMMFSSRANTHLGKRWRSVSEGEPKLIQAPLSRKLWCSWCTGWIVITLCRIFFSTNKLVLLVEWLVNKSLLMSVEDAVEDINYLDSCHHQLFVANFTIVVVRKSLHAQILNLAKFYSITYCFVSKKIGIFGVRFISFPLVKFQDLQGHSTYLCPY